MRSVVGPDGRSPEIAVARPPGRSVEVFAGVSADGSADGSAQGREEMAVDTSAPGFAETAAE